jgi:hypothetical protein
MALPAMRRLLYQHVPQLRHLLSPLSYLLNYKALDKIDLGFGLFGIENVFLKMYCDMSTYFYSLELRVLDEHENSNKENPRNREPGCICTIEY